MQVNNAKIYTYFQKKRAWYCIPNTETVQRQMNCPTQFTAPLFGFFQRSVLSLHLRHFISVTNKKLRKFLKAIILMLQDSSFNYFQITEKSRYISKSLKFCFLVAFSHQYILIHLDFGVQTSDCNRQFLPYQTLYLQKIRLVDVKDGICPCDDTVSFHKLCVTYLKLQQVIQQPIE